MQASPEDLRDNTYFLPKEAPDHMQNLQSRHLKKVCNPRSPHTLTILKIKFG